jgi:hypothetical protein
MGKTYRFYYNGEKYFPQIWSVDEGDSSTEINVVNVVYEAPSEGRYLKTADNESEPKVFMIYFGRLEVSNGVAYIKNV